jgi:toxin CcdB
VNARQFDVFRTGDGALVVVLQNDLLDALRTRVVAPLVPVGGPAEALRGVNPQIAFGEGVYVLMPQYAATLTLAELGAPIGTVAHARDAVVRALDLLVTGV